jgi:hypothetical protein
MCCTTPSSEPAERLAGLSVLRVAPECIEEDFSSFRTAASRREPSRQRDERLRERRILEHRPVEVGSRLALVPLAEGDLAEEEPRPRIARREARHAAERVPGLVEPSP